MVLLKSGGACACAGNGSGHRTNGAEHGGTASYGAMYQNRKTPDGFMTGADGAWME